ncbi:FtsX-like permease family protein [Dubosiella muris]|uniref:ABC transporter permease n=2 Tax=Dubosiella TaxID=1937008 RepID=A0AC61R9R1_9FIRM|nr:ABC transporter permease [Dubosiella muris]TGY66928.1 ABC transporter permease [Dubosiella muris]
MSLFQLAWQNFVQHARRYSALIFSLSFTVFVYFNFENIRYSSALGGLDAVNLERIATLLNVVKVVLVCFMISFIWYASNVFLKNQKKEIGIYVFLGLTNTRIGMLYAIENLLVGLVSIVAGIVLGTLFSYLFTMVFVRMSALGVAPQFSISVQAIAQTALLFSLIYGLVTLKGMWEIRRSTVLHLISAARQNEKVARRSGFLLAKALLGCATLGIGYAFAIKDGGMDVLANAMIATVCVIVGTYWLFGGFLPFLFQCLQKNKRFLYGGRRVLWINNLVFRMKQNYRSYAMVCILLICAVTALGCGFTLNNRIQAMREYSMQYDYQLISASPNQQEHFDALFQDVVDRSTLQIGQSEEQLFIPYSNLADFDIPKPEPDQCVKLAKKMMLSLYTDPSRFSTTLDGKPLECVGEVRRAVAGFMQDKMEVPIYVIDDALFNATFPEEQRLSLYNYKLADSHPDYAQTLQDDPWVEGVYIADKNAQSDEWLSTIFTFCVFLFLVFLIAACSILFIKQYNDSFEDIAPYAILQKLGVDRNVLKRSIAKECSLQFGLDFVIMSLSSFFSLLALSKIAGDPMEVVFFVSNAIILVFIVLCDLLCIRFVQQNVLS